MKTQNTFENDSKEFYQNFFDEINFELGQFASEKCPYKSQYSYQIFKNTPWYFLSLKKSVEAPVENIKKDEKNSFEEINHEVFSEQSSLKEYKEISLVELSHCQKCPENIWKKRMSVVRDSSQKSPLKILFVGDHPKTFDQKNECFIGSGGELLKKMIAAMKLEAHEFALSLAIKCYRESEDKILIDEMTKKCFENLVTEILYWKPQVIIALGGMASAILLERNDRIAQIHGQEFKKTFENNHGKYETVVIATFHPDFLVSSPSNKKAAWEDLQMAMKRIGKL